MEESLQSILDTLKNPCHPNWNVERVDLNGQYGPFGVTPLHIFATRGDLESCKYLVEAGANVNASGEDGYTPLHEAVAQGHFAVVELFLKHGADPTISAETATTDLLAEDHPEIVKLLREYSEQVMRGNRRCRP
jgi:ankyrin repeat protein